MVLEQVKVGDRVGQERPRGIIRTRREHGLGVRSQLGLGSFHYFVAGGRERSMYAVMVQTAIRKAGSESDVTTEGKGKIWYKKHSDLGCSPGLRTLWYCNVKLDPKRENAINRLRRSFLPPFTSLPSKHSEPQGPRISPRRRGRRAAGSSKRARPRQPSSSRHPSAPSLHRCPP